MDANTTMQLLEPLAQITRSIINQLQWLLGGLFGLYLIFFIVNYLKTRKDIQLLKEVIVELKTLNKSMGELKAALKKRK